MLTGASGVARLDQITVPEREALRDSGWWEPYLAEMERLSLTTRIPIDGLQQKAIALRLFANQISPVALRWIVDVLCDDPALSESCVRFKRPLAPGDFMAIWYQRPTEHARYTHAQADALAQRLHLDRSRFRQVEPDTEEARGRVLAYVQTSR